MSRKFVPTLGRVWVKPLKRNTVVASLDKNLEEYGEVMADYLGDYKKGDMVFFQSHMCDKATDDEGNEYYVVLEGGILGKYVAEE